MWPASRSLLHEICLFSHNPMIFIWYQRPSESRLWEWAQPRRALPGFPPIVGGLAARSVVAPALAKCCSVFPFQIYWSVFDSEQQKACQSQKTSSGCISFAVLVSLARCIICANDNDKKCVFLFQLPLMCRQRPFPNLPVSVMVLKFEKIMWSFTVSLHCLSILSCFVSGQCIFVFKG